MKKLLRTANDKASIDLLIPGASLWAAQKQYVSVFVQYTQEGKFSAEAAKFCGSVPQLQNFLDKRGLWLLLPSLSYSPSQPLFLPQATSDLKADTAGCKSVLKLAKNKDSQHR